MYFLETYMQFEEVKNFENAKIKFTLQRLNYIFSKIQPI